jgi:uncharacterized lipoprotein
MKTFSQYIVLTSVFFIVLAGCSSEPSPLGRNREQEEAREKARRQADFFKTSPTPAGQPGQ